MNHDVVLTHHHYTWLLQLPVKNMFPIEQKHFWDLIFLWSLLLNFLQSCNLLYIKAKRIPVMCEVSAIVEAEIHSFNLASNTTRNSFYILDGS